MESFPKGLSRVNAALAAAGASASPFGGGAGGAGPAAMLRHSQYVALCHDMSIH